MVEPPRCLFIAGAISVAAMSSSPDLTFGGGDTAATSTNGSIRKFSDPMEPEVQTLTGCPTLLNPEALAHVEL